MFVRVMCFVSCAALLLAGCGGSGGGSDSSDGSSSLDESITTLMPANHAASYIPYSYMPDYTALTGQIEYTAVDLPLWASVDSVTGLISGTPSAADLSAYQPIKIALSNGAERITHEGHLVVQHGAALRENSAYDFYSRNFAGEKRLLRNDLSAGELRGEVQFVQSHSLAPKGNYQENKADQTKSRYMPRITAQREALLLFIPEEGVKPVTVEVEYGYHGQPTQSLLQMAHPNDLLRADNQTRLNAQYSTRAWSIRLPWDEVRNGLSLRFIVDRGAPTEQEGVLSAEDIDIGAASQLVFQSLRLGMLTHASSGEAQLTLYDPVLAAADYFQTLPVSKLIMGSYADMKLDRVIINTGHIYDVNDPDQSNRKSKTNGDVYSGDMRERVAKSQVSVGINMANFGYTSNNMNQSYPHVFKQITNHHAWGMYQNGRVRHGLSGGNGIGTLVDTSGNEASHEWGHAYGLGHYPGQGLTSDGRWANHHADSGWGYDSHRQRMRNGVSGAAGNKLTFNRDAMSGGVASSPLSRYTYYTGFSARLIQNDLAKFPIPDASFPTGYKKWSTEAAAFVSAEVKHPKPLKVGVPVATILGGYDPVNGVALIYPVFHGNYGNTFALPEPEINSAIDACWVELSNAQQEVVRVRLSPTRHAQGGANQLHFNLAAEFKPTLAQLFCRMAGVEKELTRTSFDGEIPALPPVGIVGWENGTNQLKAREMLEIEQGLLNLGFGNLHAMNTTLALKIASYSDEELREGLPSTWGWLEEVRQHEQAARNASAILTHSKHLGLAAPERLELLTESLLESGLIESSEDLLQEGGVISGNKRFFSHTTSANGKITLPPLPVDLATADRWIMDRQGKLRSAQEPWRCLQSNTTLVDCNAQDSGQRWSYDENIQAIRQAPNGQCLDLNNSNQTLGLYGCHGGWNQKWSGIEYAQGLWLDYLDRSALQDIAELTGR